MIEYIDMLPIW